MRWESSGRTGWSTRKNSDTPMNKSLLALPVLVIAIAASGCVLNRPRLTERTVNPTNGVISEKSMKVTSFVLWPAKESVSNQKASISAKTMSTGVDSLAQEGGGTNVVDALKALDSILGKIRPTP